jgi:hypothetical protein
MPEEMADTNCRCYSQIRVIHQGGGGGGGGGGLNNQQNSMACFALTICCITPCDQRVLIHIGNSFLYTIFAGIRMANNIKHISASLVWLLQQLPGLLLLQVIN